VRDSLDGFQVLMVRRDRDAGFMGGAHVFPGGSIDPVDGGEAATAAVSWSGDADEFSWRSAALRELAEEAGIALSEVPVEVVGLHGGALYEAVLAAGTTLDAHRLHYLSNWVTPVGVPRRFDTRFFVTALPGDTVAVPDDAEVFDAVWVDPAAALKRGDAGGWRIELPTKWHLELIAGLSSVDRLIGYARSVEPERIEPRLSVGDDGNVVVLMPDDPGYAEALSAG
jgi:8-oxo-dGTP pyrophosphatase MutT (NUDIX family)